MTDVISSEKMRQPDKFAEFLQRLKERLENLNKTNQLPKELNNLIDIRELRAIYSGLVDPTLCDLDYLKTKLNKLKAYRLSKEQVGIPHTLNFIVDPITQDIYLMLETKSKYIDVTGKRVKAPHSPASQKTAWRIDEMTPIKYSNTVIYFKEKSEIAKLKKDLMLSWALQIKGAADYVNNSIIGLAFKKLIKEEKENKSYQRKISIYSKIPEAHSLQIVENPNKLKVVEKLRAFLQRIQNNLEVLNKEKIVPPALESYIGLKELQSIYAGLIGWSNQNLLEQLEKHQAYRLSKENSHFSHTINLIVDPLTQEIYLILETKSKVLSSNNVLVKNYKVTPKLSGSFKTTKPSWRIDCAVPEKFANSVVYINTNNELEEVKKEVSVSQELQVNGRDTYINMMIQGRVFKKQTIREMAMPQGSKKLTYEKKVSIYSRWAEEGDLCAWLERNPYPNQELLKCFTTQLLTAIQHMHEKGWVHQDIKLKNILVFKEQDGAYRLALTDFGSADTILFPKSIPLASLQYESPEISAAHFFCRDKPGYYYNWLHQEGYSSYGKDIFVNNKSFYRKQMDETPEVFSFSNPKNDIWAAGITLYAMYHHCFPVHGSREFQPKIIEGLLCPERENRLSAADALSQHLIFTTPKKKEVEQKKSLDQEVAIYLKQCREEIRRFRIRE